VNADLDPVSGERFSARGDGLTNGGNYYEATSALLPDGKLAIRELITTRYNEYLHP